MSHWEIEHEADPYYMESMHSTKLILPTRTITVMVLHFRASVGKYGAGVYKLRFSYSSHEAASPAVYDDVIRLVDTILGDQNIEEVLVPREGPEPVVREREPLIEDYVIGWRNWNLYSDGEDPRLYPTGIGGAPWDPKGWNIAECRSSNKHEAPHLSLPSEACCGLYARYEPYQAMDGYGPSKVMGCVLLDGEVVAHMDAMRAAKAKVLFLVWQDKSSHEGHVPENDRERVQAIARVLGVEVCSMTEAVARALECGSPVPSEHRGARTQIPAALRDRHLVSDVALSEVSFSDYGDAMPVLQRQR